MEMFHTFHERREKEELTDVFVRRVVPERFGQSIRAKFRTYLLVRMLWAKFMMVIIN